MMVGKNEFQNVTLCHFCKSQLVVFDIMNTTSLKCSKLVRMKVLLIVLQKDVQAHLFLIYYANAIFWDEEFED